MSTLDNLRKEAKRWLKALQAYDVVARERLLRAFPNVPALPGLRDVQHALARERGFESWVALKASLEAVVPVADLGAQVASFLDAACWNHHVHGRSDFSILERTAAGLLARHPQIARHDLYTAVVCGELEEVRRRITERPEAARESGGARGWTPLLYLTYGRVPVSGAADHAVAIAELLLDHGADPNAFYRAGDSLYTALVGVAGEGEQEAWPHPRHRELYELLLRRGAGPYDTQVLYNTHFRGNVLWWLELTYAWCLATGRKADWEKADWPMLDMGGYGCGARYLLNLALQRNDMELAQWLLDRGANPNAAPPLDPRFSKRSLYEDAVMLGRPEMAALLVRYGARQVILEYSPEEAFSAACFRGDEGEARRQLQAHPEFLRSTKFLFAAAQQDRADTVALLLDLGTPVDVADERGQTALHMAAGQNAVRAVAMLLERGAPIDPVESNYKATPLGYASHYQHREMIDLLAPYSTDIWNLTFNGKVARLRELLAAKPDLAKAAAEGGYTPLWWLPNDEDLAMEIAELLIAHGADPAAVSTTGTTAADYAHKRGMERVAARLGHAGMMAATTPEFDRYLQLARDLLVAYETGDSGALKRVGEHFRTTLSWEQIRAGLLDRLKRLDAENQSTVPTLADTQFLLAREAGFPDWDEFAAVLRGGTPKEPIYFVDRKENKIRPQRTPLGNDWDTIVAAIEEQGLTCVESAGRITDAVLERIAAIPQITHLNLEGSRLLTGAGLRHLARMPQLLSLNLIGCPIDDDDLAVLRELPELRVLRLCHQWRISDAGIAHASGLEKLEDVDLMNSGTGDGAIRALTNKPQLRFLKTGNNVTAEGTAMLREFPAFRTWQGGEPRMSLMSPDAGPTFLWLFLQAQHLNPGLVELRGLDGLYGLSVHGGRGTGPFDHDGEVTLPDLTPLREMANLGWFGIGGDLCDDSAMRHIGELAKLRMLMAQGTVASDLGFEALSRSRTLAYIWGRECPGLGPVGFRALSRLPELRGMAVSLSNIDDGALALLPSFPALRELMPMDVTDNGFRHVGKCELLESLWCMYCRETGDAATEQIAGFRQLRTYYAGRTKISDRSLEILGAMDTLEKVELWECKQLTNAGLAHLAKLPRLRALSLGGGMPGITLEGTKVFPQQVNIDYWP
ncbi:MAG: ankyrin repeat domain-containing protein [Acidobacteria bacterium]|nr:ankyrin repeat domain-containing protein [Acidobacteriota bacterium]